MDPAADRLTRRRLLLIAAAACAMLLLVGLRPITDVDMFWQLRKEFSDKYGTEWVGTGQPAPSGGSSPAP